MRKLLLLILSCGVLGKQHTQLDREYKMSTIVCAMVGRVRRLDRWERPVVSAVRRELDQQVMGAELGLRCGGILRVQGRR
jgi:hypothetical protein